MQWYYSANGQQQGPVSPAELEALVRAGTVTAESLVWREGMSNWAAYSTVATPATSMPPLPLSSVPAAGQARCAECGQDFPKDDMVTFGGAHVCAACKPLFFQKLKEGVPAGGAILWKSKKRLVTSLNPVLPARCIKCNAPTDSRQKKRTLSWHSPAVYLSLMLGLLVYVIIALCVRKSTVVMVSVCETHRVQRRNAILTAWLLVVLGIGAFAGGLANDAGWVAGVGGLLFVGGIIYGIVRGRLVYATKIDKERVWMGGCGPEFLADLPEWTGG